MNHKPKLRLTVPTALWEAVAEECGPDLADVLLFGARLDNNRLTFRTQAAHDTARKDGRFQIAAGALKITLVKPSPFPGEGDRLTAKDARADLDMGGRYAA